MKKLFLLIFIFATFVTTLTCKDKNIMSGKVIENSNIVIIERLDGSELIKYNNESEWYLNKVSTQEIKLAIPSYVNKNKLAPMLFEDSKGVEYISYDNAKTWTKYNASQKSTSSTEEINVKREYIVEMKNNFFMEF